MLYLKSGKLHVVILETENLEELKKGRPAVTPDKEVTICWTPAPGWLAEQIRNSGGDARKIALAVEAASKMPQEPMRPYHEKEEVRFPHAK